jgi:membrane-associated protease RseP (regulator of RpoE activity)
LIVVWAVLIVLFIAFMVMTHEAGHFLAAKAVGIKPETFSIGFGPEIVGWDRGGTRYAIKWIPAGGSVKILGMNPDEEIPEDLKPYSYYEAPPWKRAVVVVAGSFVHLCIALFLFYLIFWPVGYQVLTGRIGQIQKTVKLTSGEVLDGPAYEAGLKKGDLVVAVDGKAVDDWSELSSALQSKPGEQVTLKVQRGDETFTVKATLLDVDGRGILGIRVDTDDTFTRRSNPLNAVGQAVKEMGRVSGALFKGLGSLFSVKTLKELVGLTPRTQESPQSIVGATRLTFQAAGQGASVFLYVVAYLFFFLAIFNLLPLPPFDGGHLLVIVVEKVTGKRIDVRKLMPIAWAVIIVLSLVALRLAMLDIFNPLRNPFKP